MQWMYVRSTPLLRSAILCRLRPHRHLLLDVHRSSNCLAIHSQMQAVVGATARALADKAVVGAQRVAMSRTVQWPVQLPIQYEHSGSTLQVHHYEVAVDQSYAVLQSSHQPLSPSIQMQAVVGVAAGTLADNLVARQWSVRSVRQWLQGVGMVGPAIALVLATQQSHGGSPYYA